ncbi:helix-turn-helix domain-containing protein [Aureisphaera galaxeae]|uniref:helix-turn-helix domain-containing protein n=1 Tax=Aureisphaera galaxeae TaxID=1538023 RepID=UPI0023508273|nr:helix-turn-helix domain-containing protein [Aureisphaera galaxeae]MDC8004019.1 helix-turn-helix domain-containing protein [Aureisphaera galaxeae]
MVNTLEFSKRLQKILEFYGLSATAFSEKISFNRSTISHLLSGRNKPSLEFVMKVLEEFPEVELYWLLNGKGTFPSTSKEAIPEKQIPKAEDLFHQPPQENPEQENQKPEITPVTSFEEKKPPLPKNDSEIDQIIIFYKDGSFKAYR